MAVLKLPVDFRVDDGLYVARVNSRAAQQSAFNPAAIQHVASAGSAWEGYMDLLPMLERDTWSECRRVLAHVLSGEHRLFVPIIDGAYTYDPTQLHNDETWAIYCAEYPRADINRAGTKMRMQGFRRGDPPNRSIPVEHPEDGTLVTILWHGRENVSGRTVRGPIRSALTQMTGQAPGDFEQADRDGADAVAPSFGEFVINAVDSSNNNLNRTSMGNSFYLLDPPVPQMFREDTATGDWCAVQFTFCEPFLAAVITNDDALGYTKRDRSIIANRIEFVSSNIWD